MLHVGGQRVEIGGAPRIRFTEQCWVGAWSKSQSELDGMHGVFNVL